MEEQWYVYNPKKEQFVKRGGDHTLPGHIYVEPGLLSIAKEIYSGVRSKFKAEFPFYILMSVPSSFNFSISLDTSLIVMVEDGNETCRYMVQPYLYHHSNDKEGYIEYLAHALIQTLAIDRYLKDEQ